MTTPRSLAWGRTQWTANDHGPAPRFALAWRPPVEGWVRFEITVNGRILWIDWVR